MSVDPLVAFAANASLNRLCKMILEDIKGRP